jgi:hypothetical protein
MLAWRGDHTRSTRNRGLSAFPRVLEFSNGNRENSKLKFHKRTSESKSKHLNCVTHVLSESFRFCINLELIMLSLPKEVHPGAPNTMLLMSLLNLIMSMILKLNAKQNHLSALRSTNSTARQHSVTLNCFSTSMPCCFMICTFIYL